VHNGFLTINKEKMSKSLGNFFILKDIFQKFSPESVRLFLLAAHYRSPIDFSDERLVEAEQQLQRGYEMLKNVKLALVAENQNEATGPDGVSSRFIPE
jgi:cysteinyl-tRNA synthetase